MPTTIRQSDGEATPYFVENDDTPGDAGFLLAKAALRLGVNGKRPVS